MNEQEKEKKIPEPGLAAEQAATPEEAASANKPLSPDEKAAEETSAGPAKADRKEKARDLEKQTVLLTASLEKAQKELEETKAALMRTAAEYDNYRKRSTKEKEGAFNNGVGFAVNTLLSLVDTLEKAEAAPTADEEYKKGITLTLTKCRESFKILGVEEIEALGTLFDPNIHSAVMQTDEGESGTVTQVFQKGYRLGDKIIRHAMVAVAN